MCGRLIAGLPRGRAVRVTVVALALLTLLVGMLVLRASRFLPADAGNGGAITDEQVAIGAVWDLGFQITNPSPDTPMILRAVTLAHPLPAHVHPLHVAVAPSAVFFDADGWPMRTDAGTIIPTVPLDDYRIPPGGPSSPAATVTVVLAVIADAPGAYTIGPVTLSIVAPGFFGTPIGTLPVWRTYPSFGEMCVAVDHATCHAAVDAAVSTT